MTQTMETVQATRGPYHVGVSKSRVAREVGWKRRSTNALCPGSSAVYVDINASRSRQKCPEQGERSHATGNDKLRDPDAARAKQNAQERRGETQAGRHPGPRRQ